MLAHSQRIKEIPKGVPMDILWGAWAKEVRSNESIDILGIYSRIYKLHKADFPFTVDLLVVLACEGNKSEFGRMFQLTLEMIDQDGTKLFSEPRIIVVPEGDIPLRWYDTYQFTNVRIRKHGYYDLCILVEGQQKQRVPLWVDTPMADVWTVGKEDIITHMHADDFSEWKKEE